MSQDLVNVGKNAMNVTKADIHTPYTNVIVVVGTEVVDNETKIKQYVARNGTNEGLTLEIECPWGTQEIADDLLERVKNLRYKPYNVTSALLDPATELGDAVITNTVFGGLYSQQSTFGHGFWSDYSAPEDEQMNHEYKYESTTERRITREENNTKAQFSVQQNEISAKVSVEGGKIAAESFGWRLYNSYFRLYANGSPVFTCTKDGLTVNGNGVFSGTLSAAGGTFTGTLSAATGSFSGTIYAQKGRIGAKKDSSGNWTGGFILTADKFYTDGHTTYSSSTDGVYVGIDGIGCGKDFYVSSSGVLNALSANIKGNLTVDSITFSSGVTMNGSNITENSLPGSSIAGSTVSSSKFDSTTKSTHDNGGTAYSYTNDISGTTIKDRRVTAKTGTFTNLSVSGTLTVKNGSQQGTCYTTTINGITVLAVH